MFDEAFDRLMGHEGGYSNNPADSGGETNWGISKRSYPDVDIKGLSRDGAKAIYKSDFWDALGCDALPPALAFQVFDCAVNSGRVTAMRLLKKAPDPFLFLAARLEFMTDLKAWSTFGRGWSRRIASNLRYAVKDSNA